MTSIFDGLPGCDEARAFRRNFKPVEAMEYEWVEEYAKDRFKLFNADSDTIDAKSAFIITSIGAGMGALAVGSLALPPSTPWIVVLSLFLPIVFGLGAIWYAYDSRNVCGHSAGPTVEDATEYIKDFGADGRARFLGQWHFHGEMQKQINNKKVDLYEWAAKLAIASIVSLVVPFLAGVACRFIDQKKHEPSSITISVKI